jgi:DNA (cytosine-5)-methyltransferase 3A
MVYIEKECGGYVRKFTAEECEKLQTVPVGYTAVSSNSQRIKQLGNGWTVDVITHFFKSLSGLPLM